MKSEKVQPISLQWQHNSILMIRAKSRDTIGPNDDNGPLVAAASSANHLSCAQLIPRLALDGRSLSAFECAPTMGYTMTLSAGWLETFNGAASHSLGLAKART